MAKKEPENSMESLYAQMMANSNMDTSKVDVDKKFSGSATPKAPTGKSSDKETDKKAKVVIDEKPIPEKSKKQPAIPDTKEVKEEIPEVDVEAEIEKPAEKKEEVKAEPEQEAAKEESPSVQEEQPANQEAPEETPEVEVEPKADKPTEAEAAVIEKSITEDSSETEPEVKAETEEKKESKPKKPRKSKAIKLTTERAVVTVIEDGDKKSGKFFDKDGITISNDELLSVRNTKSLYTNSDGWDKMQFLKSRMGLESANQLMDFILRYDRTRGLDKWTMSWEEERELMHKQSEQRKMPVSERKRITFRVSKEADEHLSNVMELIPAIKMSTIVNKMFSDFFDEYDNLLKNR